MTGVSILSASIEPKRIGLMHDVFPQVRVFGVLLDPATPTFAEPREAVEAACRSPDIEIKPLEAINDLELEAAFETLRHQQIGALLVSADPFLLSRRTAIAALAIKARVPVMYPYRDFAEARGLMTYGIDLADSYRQMAVYAGRLLKGEHPEDLPVAEPVKYEFLINLKAANALGVTIPPRVLGDRRRGDRIAWGQQADLIFAINEIRPAGFPAGRCAKY